jgi:hypothetical protein
MSGYERKLMVGRAPCSVLDRRICAPCGASYEPAKHAKLLTASDALIARIFASCGVSWIQLPEYS